MGVLQNILTMLLQTIFALLVELNTGIPVSTSLDRNTKVKILETLFNDNKETKSGSSKVENNIHLNISPDKFPKAAQYATISQQPLKYQLSPFHNIVQSAIPAPTELSSIIHQHPIVEQNLYDLLKPPEKSNVVEDEDDLIIKNFFPDLPFADFSKISQVLKEIARDDTITYQKKQELFDIAFSFLPKKKQNLGGKSTMVGIIAALNKHLGKDEIPQKYRIDDFIGAEDTYYSEEPMDSSDYIDDDHSDDGYYEETDEHSDECEEDDSDESEEDHS